MAGSGDLEWQAGDGHIVGSRLVYTVARGGPNMNRWRNTIFGAGLCVMMMAAAPSAALAQSSFRNYRCADGAQFIVGFFQYDKRAHLQLDGKALTLPRRVALSGSRYQGNGCDAEDHQGRGHHAQARQTAGHDMRADMKKGRNIVVSTLF